ncbi:MAG: lipocalin-like domain-containing protein [Tannerellaceae bacterium]|jgi:hypothetical protein|nr:lipocalin-like domain-containing protein [Tannerellaceae bacterium]
MKKKSIILYLTVLLLATSCYKASINGKLDGMWQLMEIEKSNGELTDVKNERIYYSVQLHLINLKKIGGGEFLGRFVHSGDSLLINDVRIYRGEDKLATKEQLAPFGFNGVSEHFKVEALTHSQMVLRSEYATLRFRKY